jgi:thiamine-phosphate pyrophosphorylase
VKGLYAITDPYLTPGQKLFEAVEAALRGGIRVLQYRDKLHQAGDQLRIAQELRALCADYNTLFIINDDVALTRAVEADGVHLGKDDMDLHDARALLGIHTMIGVSCYNDLTRAQQAQKQGADYVAFGRFFPSRTKPQARPASLDTLRQARKTLSIPIVAIGGITLENADIVIDAGADMVAVIQGLFGQADIEVAARAFSDLF